jgi:hypothetical protein
MGTRTTGLKGGTLGTLALVAVMTAVSASAAPRRAPEPPIQQANPCGKPGMAPCPLQAFMRVKIAAPLATSDSAMLATGLDRIAELKPEPSWTSWSTFARAGAAAARKGDATATRSSCKGCHDAWREAYRTRHRAQPLPD